MEQSQTTTEPDKSGNYQTKGRIFNIEDVMKVIPHRYPILMVDKVHIIQEDKLATGFKCVSGNEPFFQGHFPGKPIMPGVLIVEAMAQTACVLFLSKPELTGKLAYFIGIDGVKFRKPVVPGDLLELKIEVLRSGSRLGKIKGEAYVANQMVTEAEFTFTMVDK